MNSLIASSIFNKAVKGANFMTPTVLTIAFVTKNIVYELSTGRGIGNDKIWGLTFVEYIPGETSKRRFDLSKCCHSMDEVEETLSEIKAGE